MSNCIYEKRIVAFIDILGFKNHIDKSITNPEYSSHLLKVMNKISTIKTENDTGILSQQPLGKEVSVFSDCVVISYPISFNGGIFHIILDLIHIQLELIFGKMVLRGGIAIGDLYHKDNIVFGPAMVKAYELENKIAQNPRVVIPEKTLLDGLQQTKLNHQTIDEEFSYIKKIIQCDDSYLKDKLYFIDFLSQCDELNTPDLFLKLLEILKNLIVKELTNEDASICVKYEWLKNYYNSTVKKLQIKDKNYEI